jgi:hypothetical protein
LLEETDSEVDDEETELMVDEVRVLDDDEEPRLDVLVLNWDELCSVLEFKAPGFNAA